MESLIQAGNSGLRIKSVDIRVNKRQENQDFLKIFRIYLQIWNYNFYDVLLYRPGKFAYLPAFSSSIIHAWDKIFIFNIPKFGPIKNIYSIFNSLSILAWTGFLCIAIGLIGIKIKSLRKVQNEILYLIKKIKNKEINNFIKFLLAGLPSALLAIPMICFWLK